MRRGLRLVLVGALTLTASGIYTLHPRGMALAWQLLLEHEQMAYGLLLLSQVAIVGGCLFFLGRELTAYCRWKVGHPEPQDAQREADWAVALHRFGHPARLLRTLAENGHEAWNERRRTYARAQLRWPRKKRELEGWLAQNWSKKIWLGVALVVGGEALVSFLSYRIPGYAQSPLLSLTASLVGMAVGNALMLLAWVAGNDDDDDGPHRWSPAPHPGGGHKHPKHVRRNVRRSVPPALRVQRATKQGVPQAWSGK